MLLLQILAAIGNYQYSRMRILHTTFEFLSAFYKIDKFVTGPFETSLWNRHCYFLNKQGIQVCVVSNVYPGWEKISIIWKIWNFHPVLKFHLGLAKPSWNFNSVYWIGFCTCNFFFYQGFLSQTLTVDRTAAEGRGHLSFHSTTSTLLQTLRFFLQLCMWDDYHVFLIATLVLTKLLLD